MRLDYFVRRFAAAAQVQTSRAEGRLSAAAGKLDALSPLKVLSRGYSIVYRTARCSSRRASGRGTSSPCGCPMAGWSVRPIDF